MFRHMREYSSRIVDVNRQDPVRAWCNGPEIKQVVLNLVANALQATPDGGRLDIRIASSPDSVDVLFTDTGSGMTPETLEHIFEPLLQHQGTRGRDGPGAVHLACDRGEAPGTAGSAERWSRAGKHVSSATSRHGERRPGRCGPARGVRNWEPGGGVVAFAEGLGLKL